MNGWTLTYLPGRGSSFQEGLGAALRAEGYLISGLDLDASFLRLQFQEQIDRVVAHVEQAAWSSAGRVVATSYGAYLLLHALADATPFPGKILIFSPVLGAALVACNGTFQGSIPPRSNKLLNMAKHRTFPQPAFLEIHTGAKDEGCDPALAKRFIQGCSNAVLHCVDRAGHSLGRRYELDAVARFLSR